MCFSANASFAASGALGVVGVASLVKAKTWPERFCAAVPLFFSIQQFIEGIEWLVKTPGLWQSSLAHGFLFFAMVFWPVYIPLCVYLNERETKHKKPISVLLVLGAATAVYSLIVLVLSPVEVYSVLCCHIRYAVNIPFKEVVGVSYVAATCGSLLLSGKHWLNYLGLATAVALFASLTFTANTYISVWCFFAALLSIIIFLHFYSDKIHELATKRIKIKMAKKPNK